MGCCLPLSAEAKRHGRSDALTDSVMCRIFRYAQQIDTTGRSNSTSYAYTKFQMRTNKRNATLMLVPTMYAVSHGAGRKFITEFYNRVVVDEKGVPHISRLLNLSTIPHHRNTMTSMLNYMTPNVYGETLFQENILSPFHRTNKRYYKYAVTPLPYGMAQVYAYPRIKNTQLVETRAIVHIKNGQIYLCDFEGEYDMSRFYISLTMGKEGFKTLGPIKCDMRANFQFMGNKITGKYTTIYNLPKVLSDSLNNVEDTTLMAKVRPVKLNTDEEMIYRAYYDKMERRKMHTEGEGVEEKKNNIVKDVLWDVVGDNLLNRISSGFGKQSQGYFRIDPIFNPLYMGYSQKKGVVYKPSTTTCKYHWASRAVTVLSSTASISTCLPDSTTMSSTRDTCCSRWVTATASTPTEWQERLWDTSSRKTAWATSRLASSLPSRMERPTIRNSRTSICD